MRNEVHAFNYFIIVGLFLSTWSLLGYFFNFLISMCLIWIMGIKLEEIWNFFFCCCYWYWPIRQCVDQHRPTYMCLSIRLVLKVKFLLIMLRFALNGSGKIRNRYIRATNPLVPSHKKCPFIEGAAFAMDCALHVKWGHYGM